jgi:hypothetical protein
MGLFQHERTTDRCAIVGTAQTWRDTPWDDAGLTILTLNDAFALGFPRIDVQFELHPLDSFVFRNPKEPTKLTPADLPPGRYMRPDGYLDWLQKQSHAIPVLLNPNQTLPTGWPRAELFPAKEVCDAYRDILQIDPTWKKPYIASGPSWMMLYALHQGYTEIQIYGIHLATEREYLEQRANFESLIAYAIGKGVKIVLPPGTPICKTTSVYCLEPRMSQSEDGIRWKLGEASARRDSILAGLSRSPWWQPRHGLREDLIHAEVDREDLKQQLSRCMFRGHIARPEWQTAMRG